MDEISRSIVGCKQAVKKLFSSNLGNLVQSSICISLWHVAFVVWTEVDNATNAIFQITFYGKMFDNGVVQCLHIFSSVQTSSLLG